LRAAWPLQTSSLLKHLTEEKTMNALVTMNNDTVTMTSLELVEFINSQRSEDEAELRHRDFTAKAPRVLGEEMSEKFRTSLKDAYGRDQPGYRFPKREACLMAMSYSYELQAQVFDKMTALEGVSSIKIPQSLPDALRLAADLADQKAKVEQQLAIAAPKAEALDRIASAEGAMCITNAAKALQVNPKQLFAWLQAHNWIYRRQGSGGWVAYQERIKLQHLDHKVTTVARSDGSERVVEQVLVTARGLAKLSEQFSLQRAA
jgi:phage antirepressor YoqD-like protein